jgi:hypothetical protein
MRALSEDDAKEVSLDKMLNACYSSLAGVVVLLDYLNVIMRPIEAVAPYLIELKLHSASAHFFPSLSIYLVHHHFSLKETGLKWLLFFNGIILFELQLHKQRMVSMIKQQSIFVLSANLDRLVADFGVYSPRA